MPDSLSLAVRALPKWWMVIPIILVSGALRPLMFYLFEPPLSINMGYLVGGFMIGAYLYSLETSYIQKRKAAG